jgi:hypothetical protein
MVNIIPKEENKSKGFQFRFTCSNHTSQQGYCIEQGLSLNGARDTLETDKEMETIEKNQLFLLHKLNVEKKLNENQKVMFNFLSNKYKVFSFWCFNFHSGFFKGFPEYEKIK